MFNEKKTAGNKTSESPPERIIRADVAIHYFCTNFNEAETCFKIKRS